MSSVHSARVHPRARGEIGVEYDAQELETGPSPRTRGNLSLTMQISWRSRSIPAHAGKSTMRSGVPVQPGVHPRARGEIDSRTIIWRPLGGPSPRTRGNRIYDNCTETIKGSIPAHAGKSWTYSFPPIRTGVHPRARGEILMTPKGYELTVGPSPRTRGNPAAVDAKRSGLRSIPAHAGKSDRLSAFRYRSRVHPRARGEIPCRDGGIGLSRGPSPRTRGNRFKRRGMVYYVRSIPAHAGKSLRTAIPAVSEWVHPRARGEIVSEPIPGGGSRGPSPRTRGNPVHLASLAIGVRSIPAHAGKSQPPQHGPPIYEVHPRARGEIVYHPRLGAVEPGPSPRTRGNPL